MQAYESRPPQILRAAYLQQPSADILTELQPSFLAPTTSSLVRERETGEIRKEREKVQKKHNDAMNWARYGRNQTSNPKLSQRIFGTRSQ